MVEQSPRSPQEPEISVVLAVGNDEDRVGHQIRSLASHLGRLGLAFEIVAVNDGSTDNSLSIATLLAATVPELRVLARNAAGRAFLRGTSEARGAVVVLLSASRAASLAPLGWALSRLAAGREAVILRGRYIVARRLMTLPVIVRASGPGMFFESLFERRAQDLGIDVVGSRPKSPTPLLLRPVLRFLAA
jgi:Glycosyl transferase family 2